MNAWYYAKGGPTTLGFLNRQDNPYHSALADAYTIGDAYHCPVLSATGPNRTYLWGGTINAGQKHGTFVAYSGKVVPSRQGPCGMGGWCGFAGAGYREGRPSASGWALR